MPNRLSRETSPYLRSHAENPVDWYPWGEEALSRAVREDKPIFLSIGYSTCHWCHVMAEESFSDGEVAEVLNRAFIPVKVDREERSDLDSVYMRACVAMNGSGGWPMTLLLTPERKPFFAATYLPKDNRNRQLGLLPLLRQVSARWESERAGFVKAADDLTDFLRRADGPNPDAPDVPDAGTGVRAAAAQLAASFDEEYGGFGTAPKFPSPHNLLFLLRYAKLAGDKAARHQADRTLQQMYRGGIFDHLGGGFARYSTDREWLAPHFEKTLYDNALLALCYAEAWQDGHLALYRTVAERTLDYCLRELKIEDGGFASGQDADAGGEEGAYYLLTADEVAAVLGESEGKHFCECYDITPEGNFHGKNIPNLLLNNRWQFVPEGYGVHREKLRHFRQQRMALARDDKVLTGWNGLLLCALARAAWVFGDARLLDEAHELADFMAEKLLDGDRLAAVYCEGQRSQAGRLDDYAFYALGLLELYRADFDPTHITLAKRLAEQILARFADSDGSFFMTPVDGEALILRPKELRDGALPCGNSAAALLLEQLWRLTAEPRWRDAGDGLKERLRAVLGDYPAGSCAGLTAMLCDVFPGRELVAALPDGAIPAALARVCGRYAPELTVLVKTPSNAAALGAAAPFTKSFQPKDGQACYYICTGGACQLPVTEQCL